MSVIKSKRKLAPCEYLQQAKLLKDVTHCYCRRFCKLERRLWLDDIERIALRIERVCQLANTIFISRRSSLEDVDNRIALLLEARRNCKLLLAEMSDLYKNIRLGHIANPFDSMKDLERKIYRWDRICEEEMILLDGVIKRDKDTRRIIRTNTQTQG